MATSTQDTKKKASYAAPQDAKVTGSSQGGYHSNSRLSRASSLEQLTTDAQMGREEARLSL